MMSDFISSIFLPVRNDTTLSMLFAIWRRRSMSLFFSLIYKLFIMVGRCDGKRQECSIFH